MCWLMRHAEAIRQPVGDVNLPRTGSVPTVAKVLGPLIDIESHWGEPYI